MVETISSINGAINGIVWGVPALTLLIGTGVLMTILLKFFQFTHFGHACKETILAVFKKKDVLKSTDKNSISQFQAMCTALSATIGTGNIAGIALAITSGGPGAIFWMWIAAIVGMMTNYSENVLGIFFRKRNQKGEWSGGSMYFLSRGLGSIPGYKNLGKILAILFSIFALFASFGIGNMGQFVSITDSIKTVLPKVAPVTIDWTVGIIVIVLVVLVILGGLKRIATTNEKIVPFMSAFYIIGSLIIICMNYDQIIPAFAAIFKGAFNFRAAGGGVAGYAVAQAITWGFKRGVFSNEAGLGSSVMVHSASNVKEPVTQGLWGIFEVFFDTIIVCTMTALVILTSGVYNLETLSTVTPGATKLGLATEAFTNSFGSIGGIFVAIAITLFAFSTMLGWNFYGTKAWEYLFGTKTIIVYKIIYIGVIFAGIALDATLAIDLSDTFNGLMAIPNLIGVITCSSLVYQITKNYTDRKFKNQNIKPMLSFDPEIQEEQEKALLQEEK